MVLTSLSTSVVEDDVVVGLVVVGRVVVALVVVVVESTRARVSGAAELGVASSWLTAEHAARSRGRARKAWWRDTGVLSAHWPKSQALTLVGYPDARWV